MIITGGEARGRRIASPEGMAVRPTASKVRQALFNIIGTRIQGASFLDVFAGSGLVGLEALSRGAENLVSIEESRKMARAIEQSLNNLGYKGTVIKSDFRQALAQLEESSFDIIFADPPYKSGFAASFLRALDRQNLIKAGGLVAIEHLKGQSMPEDLARLRLSSTRVYGQTAISFFVIEDTVVSPTANG